MKYFDSTHYDINNSLRFCNRPFNEDQEKYRKKSGALKLDILANFRLTEVKVFVLRFLGRISKHDYRR